MRWDQPRMCHELTGSKVMLCCGRRKEGRDGGDMATSPRRQTPQNQNQTPGNVTHAHRQPGPPAMVVQGDFRKVSGISTEIFRQIETVENDHDATTAAALEAVERRGEMLVRVLDPRHVGRAASDAVKRFLALQDGKYGVFLVEIVKRPGQTLGLYIREGNGHDRTDGVFISRIALESAVYNSGCLKVGDEILAVNLVDVTRMSLDDVVIIMSIPRRLVLATRQRKAGQGVSSPLLQTRAEHKAPPVVVMKRDMRDDEDREDREEDCRRRDARDARDAREARDRMDAREQLTTSRSRLGLTGLGSQHHLDSNGHDALGGNDLYYNSRPEESARRGERRNHDQWSYQPPPPPVITEQPKTQHYQPYERGYPNTLESLAEKIHAFYGGPMPGAGRRASGGGTRSGMTTPTTPLGGSGGVAYYGATRRAHVMPRSGSDQHLPRTEYATHTALRSSLKSQHGYGSRGEPPGRQQQFTTGTLTRRHRPALDYASDTEATCSASPRTSYYYYRQGLTQATRPPPSSAPLMSSGLRSNSLPRDHRGRPSAPRNHGNVRFDARSGVVGGLAEHDDSDGALSAPELPTARRDRGRLPSSPSVFTASEYRAWLSRTPSTSAIYERIRQSREMVQRQRAARFSCSAENINLMHRSEDAMAAASSSGYVSASGYRGPSSSVGGGHVTSTLDRHQYRHQSAASSAERNASSLRRMRHLLELEARHCMPTQSTPSTPSRHSPALDKQRCLEINPAEFIKYKPEKPHSMMSDSEPGVSGLLWVHLLAGRGLRSTASTSAVSTPGTPSGQPPIGVGGSGELRDLYCVLECDRVHKARTVVRTGDLVFDWDETFELDLVDNRELDLLIYSWDPQYRHKLCYKGSVRLASVLQECPMHQLALKMEPRGTLYVRLRHSDPHQTFRRRGPQTHMSLGRKPTTSLYGSELETVVAREGMTGGVPGGVPTSVTLATQGGGVPPLPLIVRRCVEEIERRGLDIIGLYRLCGSASKKRVLREAFERNARTVDLTPDNVPDINVITGVLKDYLRELPEPLFTKCLYQMMVDALSVCLPDDPAGNAKLMFSILDCLPKVNRCTLIYLLDHLALVTSQSDRNKMTAQNLAVCFGPVLMLQSEEHQELQFNQPISVLKYLLEIWPAKSVRETSMLPAPGVGGTAASVGVVAALGPNCRLSSVVQPLQPTQPATQPRPTIIGGPWTLGRASRQQPKQIVVSSPDTPTSESSPDDVVHKTPPPATPRTNGKAAFNKAAPPAAPRANGKVTFHKATPPTVFGHAQTGYTSVQGQGQTNFAVPGQNQGGFAGSSINYSGSNQNQSGSQNQANFSSSQNQANFGSSQNQANFGSSQNQANFGSSQNQANFGSSQNQANFGSSQNQANFGSSQNQANFGSSSLNFVDSNEVPSSYSGSSPLPPGGSKFGATSPSSATFLPSQNAASGLFGPTVNFLPSRDGSDGVDDPMLQTPTSSTTTEDSRKEATAREGDVEASDDDLDKAF